MKTDAKIPLNRRGAEPASKLKFRRARSLSVPILPAVSLTRLVPFLVLCLLSSVASAELKTWDGRHSIDKIDVTVVYFVPADRTPLPDWKDRVDYYCRRIERFHEREFQGQSVLKTIVQPEPFRSARATDQLRNGDANFIFFQTLREVDETLAFGRGERTAFPILLVLSDINWRPLDDFYRTRPGADGKPEFEGNYNSGRHFPGAESGGARATYLARRGVGWGLVSGDGWRVPYSGTDCVVYHEGVGHTVGLPHPEPGNKSVMSLGQYNGWISQSTLDDDQKTRLGWKAAEDSIDRRADLFSRFTALPEPLVPKPGEPVSLKLDWPEGASIKQLRVRIQTSLFGPWVEISANLPEASTGETATESAAPKSLSLGRFDRVTPVSYRVDAVLKDGRDVELWGYFQIRQDPSTFPVPLAADMDLAAKTDEKPAAVPVSVKDSIDLISLIDLEKDGVKGDWTRESNHLESPKEFGARIEIPYQPAEEYELVVIAEPLDEPNGLILGQRLADHRFLVLLGFDPEQNQPVSAIENIDGKNVGANATTVARPLFVKNRLSQVVCTVRKSSVTVSCDGRPVIDWKGKPEELGLSDYWKTPTEQALFLGAYDCRFRIHRATITALQGEGKKLRD